MAWTELTEADVLSVLNVLETSAYQSKAKGRDQAVLAEIIEKVVNHVRGYIEDNDQNRLAEGITLPERVHRPALHLVRVDLLTRLDIEVSKDRAKAADRAERFFERVAEGKVKIEQPTGAVDASAGTMKIKVLSDHERQATRKNLAGL